MKLHNQVVIFEIVKNDNREFKYFNSWRISNFDDLFFDGEVLGKEVEKKKKGSEKYVDVKKRRKKIIKRRKCGVVDVN